MHTFLFAKKIMLPCFIVIPVVAKRCSDPDATSHCENRISRRAAIRFGIGACSSMIRDLLCFSAQAAEARTKGSDLRKRAFPEQMEKGMVQYEANIADLKRDLFAQISSADTVADIGIGTGPNIRFLPKGVHVIGIEPNEFMWPYARRKAAQYGISLKLVDAICEDLPLASGSCDFVITTLTLCSVENPAAGIQEILRVLKPGGKLIFIEHVLAPSSRPILRAMQTILNPVQMTFADGCHLNRQTAKLLEASKNLGFAEINIKEFDAHLTAGEDFFNPMRTHIAGYAQKASM